MTKPVNFIISYIILVVDFANFEHSHSYSFEVPREILVDIDINGSTFQADKNC